MQEVFLVLTVREAATTEKEATLSSRHGNSGTVR